MQWQRGDPNSWTLFTMKFLDVQRLLTVTAQFSPYGRPGSSSLGWLLLFCGFIHCVYTSIFLELRGADVDRVCAFTAGFSEENKDQAVIPFMTMLTKTCLLKFFFSSFILTRHSTEEILPVSREIGSNR